MTLGDVGRKKYLIGILFHFGQKMRLGLGNMTFQALCIFWTGYSSRTQDTEITRYGSIEKSELGQRHCNFPKVHLTWRENKEMQQHIKPYFYGPAKKVIFSSSLILLNAIWYRTEFFLSL